MRPPTRGNVLRTQVVAVVNVSPRDDQVMMGSSRLDVPEAHQLLVLQYTQPSQANAGQASNGERCLTLWRILVSLWPLAIWQKGHESSWLAIGGARCWCAVRRQDERSMTEQVVGGCVRRRTEMVDVGPNQTLNWNSRHAPPFARCCHSRVIGEQTGKDAGRRGKCPGQNSGFGFWAGEPRSVSRLHVSFIPELWRNARSTKRRGGRGKVPCKL